MQPTDVVDTISTRLGEIMSAFSVRHACISLRALYADTISSETVFDIRVDHRGAP